MPQRAILGVFPDQGVDRLDLVAFVALFEIQKCYKENPWSEGKNVHILKMIEI